MATPSRLEKLKSVIPIVTFFEIFIAIKDVWLNYPIRNTRLTGCENSRNV